ncbi:MULTISPECIES: acyl carrier protein [Streptacidiphilus]|jgi:act minimal PKS acyl carrier protein|uniref:acyl carrier protein n=1 Tax=Streptacidiphilus TaxID=228398 RepID=UPI0005A95C9F|nr:MULTISPECIES: acyl carrier protein [Streptacidiphilus]
MATYTVQELTAALRECAGDSDTYDLSTADDSVLDVTFFELGYDSLAVLQVTGVIGRQLGIQIEDDAVAQAETPRLLLKIINAAPSRAA